MEKLVIYNKHKIFLYTEAILYFVLIVFIIFLHIYGNIYIRLVPLLFFLGLLGNMLFDRPILTSTYGSIITYTLLYMHGSTNVLENLYSCVFVFISIWSGEILGEFLHKLHDHYNKVEVISFNKKIYLYVMTAVFIVGPVLFNTYINGDIFKYNEAKLKFNNYISQNYNNIVIVNSRYNSLKPSGYIFEVKNIDPQNTSKIYNISVYTNNNIYDEYKDTIIEKNNISYKQSLTSFIKDKNIDNEYTDFEFDLVFENDSSILKIQKTVKDIDDLQLDNFSSELVNILEKFKEFNLYNRISKLSISIKSYNNSIQEAIIYKQNFDNKSDYFKDSLKTEYIEEN
ncbi:MAG: hypothetical protein N2749_05260 [Clostridia bacterium]|nr:hypothetical protein [Clostridia bacterium]